MPSYGADRVGANIQIQGVRQTVNALIAFEPALKDRLNDEIKVALRNVSDRARSKYPKGSWGVSVTRKKILGSVYARSGRRGDRWGDSSTAPGVRAAIFEFAGSRGEGTTPQARGMIRSLNERYGSPGRFLWSSWDELGRGVLLDIQMSVREAERDLQATLDRAGESY